MSASSPERRRSPALSLAVAGLMLVLAVSACGGEEGEGRPEDRAAIEGLVERINGAVADSDAAGWCDAYSPQSITETFPLGNHLQQLYHQIRIPKSKF